MVPCRTDTPELSSAVTPTRLAVTWALATCRHSSCIIQLPSPESQLSLLISFYFISSAFPVNLRHSFMAIWSSISSPHPPATHCFPASGFLFVTLSAVTLSVCASSPSWYFCPASRNHYIFTHPAITNSACPRQGDFSHLALLSAYSKYLHNILSMWGNLKRFGSMPFG